MTRIGIPQGLLYYEYGRLWEGFLRDLGLTVVLSGQTTQAMMDYSSGLDELCLPAKVFIGHCVALREQVDLLFVPRVVSMSRGQYMCPQMIAMPDLLRANSAEFPPILDLEINFRQGWQQGLKALPAISRYSHKSVGGILSASIKAWFQQPRQQAAVPEKGIQIGLISHPYILQDKQLSLNVYGKLQDLSLPVVTADMIARKQAKQSAKVLGKQIYWSACEHLAGAALALMDKPNPVGGIIFLTCFSCGPDALIGELIRQQAAVHQIPCMILPLDEHTAEAGLITRLEAFSDLLRRRQEP